MSKALSIRGYGIDKNDENFDIEILKQMLKVKPNSIPGLNIDQDDKSFSVFLESSKKLYVPKYWGLKNYGIPDIDKLPQPKLIESKFKGSLREYQYDPVNTYLKACKDPLKRGGILQLPPGWGKTVMALYILSKLNVKTLIIVHKDFLLNQWKERIQEYIDNVTIGIIKQKQIQTDNDIVIASLQSISMKDYPKNTFDDFGLTIIDECFIYTEKIHTDKGLYAIGDLYEIWSLKDVYELPKILSFNKLTKKFEYKKLTYAWQKKCSDIMKIYLDRRMINCTPDHKILTESYGYVKAKDLKEGDLILSKYDKRNLHDQIIAPKLNSDQKQVFFGLLLTGNIKKTKTNRYFISKMMKDKSLDDIWLKDMFSMFIAKSKKNFQFSKFRKTKNMYSPIIDLTNKINNIDILSLDVLNNLDIKSFAVWITINGKISTDKLICNTHISDHKTLENIKHKLKKEFNVSCSICKNTSRSIDFIFENDDKNNLFSKVGCYLGSEFKQKYNIENNEKYEWNKKFMDYGTIIVLKSKYTKNRTPYVYDIEVEDNHNFVLGSQDPNYDFIDGPVVSNCHHMAAQVFSRALFKVNFAYSLGLSATVTRKDGLSKVFKWFIGDVVYKAKSKDKDNLDVTMKYYYDSDPNYSKIPLLFNGKPNISKLINNICEYLPRTQMIVDELDSILKKESDREVIILSDRRNHLNIIEKLLNDKNYHSIGYYVGGMKQSDLKNSESKNIILGTFNMVSEGFDLPKLNTLVLASPKSDVEQSVGRIQRQLKQDRKYTPLVLDIADQFSLFSNQAKKRSAFYHKKGFNVNEIDKIGKYTELKEFAFRL